jgi:CheY-like chemotaxis protein
MAQRGEPRAACSLPRTTTAPPFCSKYCSGPTREMVGRARNGREAVSLAISLNPDVILMNLQIPVMGGIEAIRRLRELGSTSRIIGVTGAEEAGIIPAALKADANGYVAKPPGSPRSSWPQSSPKRRRPRRGRPMAL